MSGDRMRPHPNYENHQTFAAGTHPIKTSIPLIAIPKLRPGNFIPSEFVHICAMQRRHAKLRRLTQHYTQRCIIAIYAVS